MTTAGPSRVECLDGLRGLAALWVLTGHCVLLSGWQLAIIDKPDLGVDLFMMLSGFLMVFHYQERSKTEPWAAPRTWLRFWTRRYFRIAPLYYLALVFMLGFGPALLVWRNFADHAAHLPAEQPAAYLDHGFANIALHLSFLFGALPAYAARMPLPDWSLGLEMQFYAVFPVLMLLTRRIGWTGMVLAAAFLAAVITHATWHFSFRFPMPSFLPFKMDIFLAGMLVADSCRQDRKASLIRLGLSLLLVLQPFQGEGSLERIVIREIMVLVFFALIQNRHLPGWLGASARKAADLFSSPVCRWLGEVSYGTYLWHLPILAPVMTAIILVWGEATPAPARALVAFVVVAAIVYPLSWLTYRFVEQPGQAAGRRILRRAVKTSAADEGAGPAIGQGTYIR